MKDRSTQSLIEDFYVYSIIVQRGAIRVQCFAYYRNGEFINKQTGAVEHPLQPAELIK